MTSIVKPPCDEATMLTALCDRTHPGSGRWVLAATILGSSMVRARRWSQPSTTIKMLTANAALVALLFSALASRSAAAEANKHAYILMPPDYAAGDLPVGRKTFRVQTDLPPEAVVGITWALDGAVQAARGEELTISFGQPDTHLIEACIMTRNVNHCDRRRLGPPIEQVKARNRLISATVVHKDDPDRPVMGLGPSDFGLAYRGKTLEGRILSVQQEAPGSEAGVCMAYIFDVSGSMMGIDAKSGRGHVLVKTPDGSYHLSEQVRARFQAFAETGALNPEQDLILGGAFAGGLLTIGPVKGSKAASLPSLLEKLIVREYLRDPRLESPLWSHTALYESVALVELVLTHEAACSGKQRAIALDGDLIQFPERTAVDVNDATLEMIAKNLELNDSDWLLDNLTSEDIASMPVFAVDRKMRSFTPKEEGKRQEFIREVVQRSGGETYNLVLGSAAEIKEKLSGFFQGVRARAISAYDIFWDPDGIENPDQVSLTLANPEMRAHANTTRKAFDKEDLPRKVLADRSGRYNNAQKLTAVMFVRKGLEEGSGVELPRSAITAALEAEKRLSPPSAPLERELERTLLVMLLEQVKYSGEPEAVRRGVEALATLEGVPVESIGRIADFIPPVLRDTICKRGSAPGSGLEALRSQLCAR